MDAPAEEPKINDPPDQTDTPATRRSPEEKIPLHRYAVFGAVSLHAAAKTYETFTAAAPIHAATGSESRCWVSGCQ